MKKILLSLLWICLSFGVVLADEGMWLPIQVAKMHGKMTDAGLKLSADDIYNINQASLKDAIVRLGGGFCTAEIISEKGLLMTNHHCAYDLIQNHSAVGKDYLTDGFWAMNMSEELTNPGLTASILVRMEDVTARVMQAISAADEAGKNAAIAKVSKEIADEAKSVNEFYTADVKPIFYGNQFILSVYITYKDVRLVGAPPSSIGKFGGDTDNWMWPRHTGDFAMLRIYTDASGNPATYAADNVPLKPKHVLPISMKGVKETDYAMVMGYPGTTNRYLTSTNLSSNLDNYNQAIIDMFGARMRAYKEDMDESDEIRIALASTYASGMNTYKYFIGQSLGLRKDGLVEKKAAYEKELQTWIDADAGRKAKWGKVLSNMEQDITAYGPVNREYLYFLFAFINQPYNRNNNQLGVIKSVLAEKKPDAEKLKDATNGLLERLDDIFTEYFESTEHKAFAAMLKTYIDKTPADRQPEFLTNLLAKTKGASLQAKVDAIAADVYGKSILTSRDRMEAFLRKPSKKVLDKDAGVLLATAAMAHFTAELVPANQAAGANLAENRQLLMAARMAFESEREFAPDANSTLRITYGNVKPYKPRDAVKYKFQTTSDGILQKEDPSNPEFVVPAKLKDLLVKKDFGPYAEDGVLYTCFLSTNDITGGNSGSPVINAQGELIGVAFDGNWESMTGDLMFNPEVQRTISVDIRYVLFIIDKFAGAGHLVKEMKLVY
ncbi:MAG: S46 family peptidase [Bacteroidia bacterium]